MAHHFKERVGQVGKKKQPINNKSEKLSIHDSRYVEKENRLHLIVNTD